MHNHAQMKTTSIKRITKIYLLVLVIIVLIVLGYEGIQIIQASTVSLNVLLDTLILISLFSFFVTLLFFLATFKWNNKNYLLWLVLLINFPVAIIYSPNLFQNIHLSFIDTTTKKKFRYSNAVEEFKYKRDLKTIESKIDSLIRYGIITQPSDFGERYFEGLTYKDSLERRRGFPATPYKVPIKLSVDTLFYSPDSSNLIAGTVIRKYPIDFPQYSNGETVQYLGDAFIYNPTDSGFQFITLRTSISGCSSEQECSRALLDFYLKKSGLREGYYNLNDIRFWTSADWEKRFQPYSFD